MQIKHFSVHQTSKVVALAYFCLTLVLVPVFVVMMLNVRGPEKWFFVLAPLVYALIGYVFTALACFIYNFLAKRVGGIEFTVVESQAQGGTPSAAG